MKYRAEIDGLRCFAVIAVILYHGEILLGGRDWFGGGFVGVDVFFVISGYLISKIIFSEIDSMGRFDFLGFYERRARRILPALLVVLAASMVASYFWLIPSEVIKFAKSELATLAFASNIYFYLTATEYGAAPSLMIPLLHTWSLSVEEQFYILFPIAAIFLCRYSKHRIVVVATLLVASLAACSILQEHSQQLAFFLPFTRAWELLSGSLLAACELRYGRFQRRYIAQIAAMVGMAAILASVVFFKKSTPHPGLVTLIPVAGTALVIAFSCSDNFVARTLSAAPLRYTGAISYSLYLWHFPVFAFWRIADPESFQVNGKFFAIFLVFALSAATYHFVEQPFRYRRRWPIWKFSTAATAVAAVIATYSVMKDGFPARLDEVVTPTAMNTERAAINRFDNYIGGIVNPVVIIMGDSYARNWSVALNRYIDHKKFDVVSVSYLGCGVDIQDSILVSATSGVKYEKNCTEFDRYINDLELLRRVVAIFIVGHRPFEYSANKFRFDLASWVRRHGNNPEIYVFGNYFQLDREKYNSCVNLMFVEKKDSSVCLERANYPPKNFEYKSLPLYPKDMDFIYVDIIELQCDLSKHGCAHEGNGVPFMMDWNHLTVGFLSRILEEALKLKSPELENMGLLRFFKKTPNW